MSGITPPGKRVIVENVKTVFSISFRECVFGEEFTSDMRCAACSPGTFSSVVNQTAKLCSPCIEGAQCMGGTAIYPKPGYFRKSLNSIEFVKCPN